MTFGWEGRILDKSNAPVSGDDFKELLKELKERDGAVDTILLSNSSLDNSCSHCLGMLLRKFPSLQCYDFSNNRIGAGCLPEISDALKVCDTGR